MKLFTRARADRELNDEMAAHLAEAVDYYKAQGMSEQEAARRAQLRFGNPRAHRERIGEMNRLPVIEVLARDLHHGFRRLRQAPAFNATIIVTLALVIGATSAVFSLADAILLRPLTLSQADRLAFVAFKRTTSAGESVTPFVDGAMWAAVRDHASSLRAAVVGSGVQSVNFVSGNRPSRVQNQSIGDGYFRVLGVEPLLGREFTRDEASQGGPAVVVLSFGFWQRTFQRRDALGQTILLRGEPFTVVGVMPDRLRGISDADVWTPLRRAGQGLNYTVVARLNDGVTFEQASAQLGALGDQPFTMWRSNPAIKPSLVAVGMQETLAANARPPIVMLGWAVGAVLLIACVNIAALLMARGVSRSTEIATRMALGGSRVAVVRQLMMESVVVAVIGGSLGVVVASFVLEALKVIGDATFLGWTDVTLNWRTVAVSLGLACVTSFLFGLLPAWQTSRLDVRSGLAGSGSRSIAGGSSHLLRRLLVGAEVALGVATLVAGGLLLRQFLFLQTLDPGFSPERLYSVSASLQDARYRDAASINRLFATSIESLQRTPGIEAAAVSQGLPYQRLLNMGFTVEGRADDSRQASIANFSYVTPGFFQTFGIAMKDGRSIEARDGVERAPVVVVNDTFERIYFKGKRATGRRIHFGGRSTEIVGVSRDVQQFGAGFKLAEMRAGPIVASPTIYVPATQADRGLLGAFSPVWTVRAASGGEAAGALTRAINEADPLLPLAAVKPMEQVMADAMALPRVVAMLVGTLALAALLLAAIGIHGLIAQIVSERTREFGIRLALGASSARMGRSVAASGIAIAALGAVVGMGLSFPAASLVTAFVPNLGTHDLTTYLGVGALLVVVATVSSLAPTLRITRLDPVDILRE